MSQVTITLNTKSVSKIALAGRTAQLAADGAATGLGAAAGYGTARLIGSRLVGGAAIPAVATAMSGLAVPAAVAVAAPIAAGVLVGAGVAWGARWLMDKAFGTTEVATVGDVTKALAGADEATAAEAAAPVAVEQAAASQDATPMQVAAAIHNIGSATVLRVAEKG